MGALKLRILLLAAAAAATGPSWPAGAQCRLCAAPVTSRDETTAKQDVQIEIETSINFDRLILLGDGEGAAVIRLDGSHAAEDLGLATAAAGDAITGRRLLGVRVGCGVAAHERSNILEWVSEATAETAEIAENPDQLGVLGVPGG